MKKFLLPILLASTGCAGGSLLNTAPIKETPQTIGSKVSGYTYVPLDPLRIKQKAGERCKAKTDADFKDILPSLPDNAVRISVKSRNGSLSGSFGPATFGTAGNSYQVVLDYIQTDTTNIRFAQFNSISEYQTYQNARPPARYNDIVEANAIFPSIEDEAFYEPVSMEKQKDSGEGTVYETVTETVTIQENDTSSNSAFTISGVQPATGPTTRLDQTEETPSTGKVFNVPVYVGVGLRLTADVNVLSGNVNLSNLGAISASVEAGNSTGTLTVQTLGISGKSVASSLPLPNQINQTTIENAILSLGTIKALMYEDDINLTPRVTGLYLPFADGSEETVNQLVSMLAEKPIEWYRPCKS